MTTEQKTKETFSDIQNNLEKEWNESMEDLLQPKSYPDPVTFRDSLDDLKKYDEELKSNLKNNQITLNVLAPYLQTVFKDQKKAFVESAKTLTLSAKAKEAKLFVKSKAQYEAATQPADINEQYEMIISIHETADALKHLVKANTVVSYLVNSAKNELYQSPRYIYSSLDTLTWKIETGSTMAAYTAFTKQYVKSNNVLADTRFPLGLGFAGTILKYALCVPVKTEEEKVVAVYEFTRDTFASEFDSKDIQLILTIVRWMGFAIHNNSFSMSLMHRLELSDYLLQLTHHYHSGHTTLLDTLADILLFAKQTTAAERCNFFLVEKATGDTAIIEEYNLDDLLFKKKRKKTVVRGDGSYLSQVVFSKEIVNKFETQVEISQNSEKFKLRSIVCVPILCKCDQTLGIIQLTNKKTATEFDKDDEEILQIFAVFCAINVNSNKVYETEKKFTLLKNVDREMLLYQMNPCSHDQEMMKKHLVNLPNNFNSITWYPSQQQRMQLPQLTYELFRDVLGDQFMLLNDMRRFILTVRRSYRANPYSNFDHAFNATHKMAILLKNYRSMFSGIERHSMMIAMLCHDVDHRSLSNVSLKLTNHHLAQLYDSFPKENHHFAVTKMVMEKYGLLKYIKPEIYDKILTEIYENIVATDMSSYFENRMKLLQFAEGNLLNLKEDDNRRLIKNLMMTSCDLCDQATPFPECRKLTEDLFEEHFTQGDVMKRLNLIPMPSWDRMQKDKIPENQIQFLMVVVLPCLKTLSNIFEVATPLVSNCKEVIKHWLMLVEVKDQDTWKPEESIVKY